MVLTNWLNDLFRSRSARRRSARRNSRRTPRIPNVERLEDRTLLSAVSYTAATDDLVFDGTAAADDVDIASPAANTLEIQVGAGDTITLADDAVGNPDFTLSPDLRTLTIDVSGSPVDDFAINGGGDADQIDINSFLTGYTGSLEIDGEGDSDDVNINASLNADAGLTVSSERVDLFGDVTTSAGDQIYNVTNAVYISSGPRTLTAQNLIVNGTLNQFSNNLTADVSGAASEIDNLTSQVTFIKQGSGTIQVNDGSNYTLDIQDGTFKVGTGMDVLPGNKNINIAGPGTLDLNGFDESIGSLTGTGTVTSSAAGAVFLQVVGGVTADFGGTIQDGNGTLSLRVSGATSEQILSGANTYTGTTQVNGGGATLGIAATGVIGSGVVAGTVSVNNGGNLNTAGVINAPINGGSPGSVITALGDTMLGGGTVGFSTGGILNVNGHMVTLNSLTTADLGTTTDLGAGGTLDAANGISLSGSDQLIGSGTVNGNVTTNSGTISPGTGPGQIAFNGMLNLVGGNFDAEVDGGAGPGQAGGFDQLVLNSTIDVSGANLNTSGGVVSNPGQSIRLLDKVVAGPITGTFANVAEGDTVTINGVDFTASYQGGTGNDFTLTQAGPLEYTGDGTDEDFVVRRINSGGTDLIQLLRNGQVVDSRPAATVTEVIVNAEGGDDTLEVKYDSSGGGFTFPVTFNGGEADTPAGDALTIIGTPTGTTINTAEYTFTGEDSQGANTGFDGNVDLDGTVITFTGLEPLINTGDATHIIFNLPDVANTDVILEADGVIEDNKLTGSTFEDTFFANPTGVGASLKINGGTMADTISVQGVDGAFDADLIIDAAQAGDSVTVANTDIGSGDVDITAGSITFTGNLTTSGDAVLDATDSTISGAGTLTANDLTADAITGIQLNTTVDTIGASVSGSGAIDIDETDGVELTDVNTADGSITVQTGGDTDAINVVSQTDDDANDISITVSTGNLFVTNIDAGTGDGDVMLSVPNGNIGGPVVAPFTGILDDGDAGYSDTGMTPFSGQGFQNDVHFSASNAGNMATWAFTGLAPGMYTVAATWSTDPNRATNAPYTVVDANGASVFAINQEQTPANDYTESGTPFQQLGGTFVVDGSGTLTVSLTDVGADEFVIADAIRVELVSVAASGQVTGDVLDASADTGIDLDTTVNEVDATTSGMGNITLNESDAVTLTNVVTANGSIDIMAGGGITATNVVSTTDADANDISLTAATGNVTVGTVNAGPSAGDVNLTAASGAILDDGNNATLLTADVASLIAGDGNIGSGGATGQLDTTVSILNASSTNGSVFIGETDGLTLRDVSAMGTGTNDVTVVSSTGDIAVQRVNAENRVTLDATSGAIVDGGPANPVVEIIDDGDAGYSDTGMTPFSGQGFQNDVHFSASNAGNTATWAFAGLAPGMYSVAATWSAQSNRATDAPYTVMDANAASVFVINQEQTPANDYTESGTPFQQLGGTFVVDGSGMLIVSLTDVGADEFVIADAIRIERLDPRIRADELLALAETGIGDGDAIETEVNKLEAETTSGDVNIDNRSDLTIGGISGVNGVSSGTDSVVIRNAGAVDVTEDVTAGVDIEIVSLSLMGAQPITVRPDVTVEAGNDVFLRSSDDLDLQDSSTVTAGNTINLFGDFNDMDPQGAMISLLGTLDASGVSGNIFVTGGPNEDFILVHPDATPPLAIPPHSADGLTLDGTDGNDTYEIFFGRLNGGPDAVVIDDTGTMNSDMDQAILQGTPNNETFEIDNKGAALAMAGGFVNNTTEGEQVFYEPTLEFLTVRGNDSATPPVGGDTFTGSTSVGDADPGVEPSLTTTILLDGGPPGFGPGALDAPQVRGDELILNSLDNVFQIIGKTIFVDGSGDMQVVTQNPPLPDAGDFQGIHFRNIESLPLEPIGPDTLLFDFDNTPQSTVTQPGYTSVADTQLYGVGGNTFGWDANVASFDGGPLSGTSGIEDDLLRDGHQNIQSNTFTTDIANGVYRVTVKIGDPLTAHDNLRVSNGDTGQILLDDIDVAAGEFVSQTVVVQVTDGTLDLTIANLGGLPDWVINGLEIRPGQLLTIGTMNVGPPPLEANGAQETTLEIFNVTPGALVTVSGGLDSDIDADEFIDQDIEIVSMDAAPEIAGVQIAADMAGHYFFTFRHPFGRGTGFFAMEEVSVGPMGGQTGCTAIDFTAPSVRRFDFGTETSPLQDPESGFPNTPPTQAVDGYVRVVGTDVFDLGTGFGWNAGVGSFNSGPVDEAVQGELRQDGNSGILQNTFSVELEDGTYFVNITLGDDGTDHDNLQVSAEGNVVLTDIDTSAGVFQNYTFQVNVTDGLLDLTIANLGGLPNWVINGLEIRPMLAGATFTPPTATPADGTTIATITGSAPDAANLYLTVTTDQGVLINDASAEYAGHQVAVDAAGDFTIELQSPTSMTDVTANLTVLAVDGSVQDATSVMFTGFAGTPPRRFDFNRGTSPTATDYTGVLVSDSYNAGAGYGWVTKPSSFDYYGANATTVDLYRDGAYQNAGAGGARTFGASAVGATQYDVRVYIGARFAAVGQVMVSVEGASATSTPVSANNYTTVTLSGVVDTDMDGILEITIQGVSGSWYVNGIDVAESSSGLPPASPLLFAAQTGLGADALTPSQLEGITLAAIARLGAAGEDVSALEDVTLRISNLDGQGALGLAGSQLILIDDDGLGYGWFIDQSPLSDEEFSQVSDTELVANSAASLGRADLLTVVMHELGHILGHADLDPVYSEGNLMSGRLGLGLRRLPSGDHAETEAAETSTGSAFQSQELNAAPVSQPLGHFVPAQTTSPAQPPVTVNYVDPGQTASSTVSQSQPLEDAWIRQTAIAPELRPGFAASETEDAPLAESGEDNALAVGSSPEEQDALNDLFADLTQSELASKSLWDQMEN